MDEFFAQQSGTPTEDCLTQLQEPNTSELEKLASDGPSI